MTSRTVVAIVQARMGSSRFPGKTLTDLGGVPLLGHVVRRARAAKLVDHVLVATTTESVDDPIVDWCRSQDIPCFRGPTENVLGRYRLAWETRPCDVVVRITADNAFGDPEVIDGVVGLVKSGASTFASNAAPPSFPEGLDVEAFTSEILKIADDQSTDAFEREHVTQFFHRRPDLFPCANFGAPENNSRFRVTIDYPQDFALAREIVAALGSDQPYGWRTLVQFLTSHPDIASLNASVPRSAMHKGNPRPANAA